MKRSEAVKKIENVLLDHYGISRKNAADEILLILEESGMKAPIEKNCPVLLTTEHTWEPENDVRN